MQLGTPRLLLFLAIGALAAGCGVEATPTPGPGNTPTSEPTATPTPTPHATPDSSRPAWLNDLIIRFWSEPVANPPIVVKEYVYKGDPVYFVPQRCCDIFSDLYDRDGNLIAHPDGGIAGNGDGRAPDFFETATYVRTVWEDPRGEVDYERVVVNAPIESIDVVALESFPIQYKMNVVSGLPNGCARFDHWTVDLNQQSKTFTVAIFNSVPAPGSQVACTMIYGLVEHSIPLTGVEPGGTYRVNVNDKTTTFDAQ